MNKGEHVMRDKVPTSDGLVPATHNKPKPKQEKVADHIYRINDGIKRKKPYMVEIHRNGEKYKKAARTKKEAETFRNIHLHYLETPKELQVIQLLKNIKVIDIVLRYLQQISIPKKREPEIYTLAQFAGLKVLKADLPKGDLYGRSIPKTHTLVVMGNSRGNKSMYDFDDQDAQSYIAKRLEDVVEGTVQRELNSLKRVWNVAWKWGYKRDNPWLSVVIPDYRVNVRTRTIEPGELNKLLSACSKCRGLNRLYVPLAIHLALETGMRQQEIFNLTWNDINFEERTIHITKSKIDEELRKQGLHPGRWIALPIRSRAFLTYLYKMTSPDENMQFSQVPKTDAIRLFTTRYPDKARIFPLTEEGKEPKDAFKQAWTGLRERARITTKPNDGTGVPEELNFHDLRRAASSMFEEAELTGEERDIMMGHLFEKKKMREVYSDRNVRIRRLQRIAEKLDVFALKGREPSEVFDDILNTYGDIVGWTHGEKYLDEE